MDPWVTLLRMANDGALAPSALDDVRRLIGSACIARVEAPRSMVSGAMVSLLDRGIDFGQALSAVEELVAIRHNRMLIAAGRRGIDEDARPAYWRGASVLAFRLRTPAA